MTEEEKPKGDERITWVRAAPLRELVQRIKPMPSGFTVTTQWIEKGEIVRQDVEVSIVGVVMESKAEELTKGKG